MDEHKGDEMTDSTTEPSSASTLAGDNTEITTIVGVSSDEQPEGEVAAGTPSSQADDLEAAIQAFLADISSGVVSVSRVVNPLLQVWSVAREVDAEVAVPVEQLLSVLVGRTLTTSKELIDTMTEVRAALAGSAALASV